MTTTELCVLLDGTALTAVPEKAVQNVYVCDLLSWVMAKAKSGTAWITVQTHINVTAVASLLDVAAVIIPEGIEMEKESADKAQEEGIPVVSTQLSAFEICGRLHDRGLKGVV